MGGIDAVVPSVAGQAWITDISQVGLEPTDPFPEGYTLSDTWMGTIAAEEHAGRDRPASR